MFSNVFEDIINLLPGELIENEYFNSIIEVLKKEIPTEIDYNLSRVSISSDIYLNLIGLYPELTDKLETNTFDCNLVNMTLFTNKGLIALSVKKKNNIPSLKLVVLNGASVQKEIDLKIVNGTTILERLIKVEKDDFITSFEYDLKAYNVDGELLDIDYEDAKDLKFSEEFFVPVTDARKYRLNFKNYIDFLNRNRIKEMNRLQDNEIIDNTFRGPFNIENLEQFVRSEMLNDIKDIIGEENMVYKPTNIFKSIISNIKNFIGDSNLVLISENTYQFLQNYLLGINRGILYNKGLLIKELNGVYTLFYLHFENGQIMGIRKELSSSDIDLILENNKEKENITNIKEFFGLGNTLK